MRGYFFSQRTCVKYRNNFITDVVIKIRGKNRIDFGEEKKLIAIIYCFRLFAFS